jgi:CubicO group peptidase (beta-lactamase class C family)
VKDVTVTFDNKPVLAAETTIAMSEDPDVRFYFTPTGPGILKVEVKDSRGQGWSKSPATEARITVRHLLEMTSGLTEGLGFEAEPGARFFYNTPAYAVSKSVLESTAKRPLDELTRHWLTEPLGMNETAWRQRPPALASGNPTGLQ